MRDGTFASRMFTAKWSATFLRDCTRKGGGVIANPTNLPPSARGRSGDRLRVIDFLHDPAIDVEEHRAGDLVSRVMEPQADFHTSRVKQAGGTHTHRCRRMAVLQSRCQENAFAAQFVIALERQRSVREIPSNAGHACKPFRTGQS